MAQKMEQAAEADHHTSARDKVRRCFIDKMAEAGMRFQHRTSAEDQRRKLDQMADDLAHMSEDNLNRLFVCLRSKGAGSRGDFWPPRVTILKYAEDAQPRPTEEIRGLQSWFISQAGRDAATVPGRLVAEFDFWTSHKHPPMSADQKRMVASYAGRDAARADRLDERRARGALEVGADQLWLDQYRAKEAKLIGWVSEREVAA